MVAPRKEGSTYTPVTLKRTLSPSSYRSSDYITPRLQKLAFRVRPLGDVQGIRTLSLDSCFDNAPYRQMGSWFIQRFSVGEIDESRSHSARPCLPFEDIHNATTLRQRSSERVEAPDPTDLLAISSVPAEVNDLDNEVLDGINQFFEPSIEQSLFNPPQLFGNSPDWDTSRRRWTIDSGDIRLAPTVGSSKFPSIDCESTPATSAWESSRTRGGLENGDAAIRVDTSVSKDAPPTEDTHQTGDATPR